MAEQFAKGVNDMDTRERAVAVRNTALVIAGIFLVAAFFTGSPATVTVVIVALMMAAWAHLK